MTQNKDSVYASPENEQDFRQSIFTFAVRQVCSHIRIPIPKSALQKRDSIVPETLLYCKVTPEGQAKRLKILRRRIESGSKLCAVLNWMATVLGYVVMKWEKTQGITKNAIETGIAFVSLIQIGLIVRYWRSASLHAEAVRESINIDKLPIPRLGKSPKRLLQCCLECVFHAAVLCPWINYSFEFVLFGDIVEVSTESLVFGLIVVRNYHTVRYLYWSSHLSGMRVRFFAHMWKVQSRYVFVLKCYLAEYAVKLVVQVFFIMLVVSAFVHYAVEREAFDDNTWNHFWLVALTQSTIGYGDVVPYSFFGQVAILISCFVGILLLGLINAFFASSTAFSSRESEMYYYLTHARAKKRNKLPTVILIQRWWRFMKARLRKSPQVELIFKMYSQLTACKRINLRSHNMHYLLLEQQVRLLEFGIRNKVKQMKIHLHPVLSSEALVCFMQSQHFLQCQVDITNSCRYLLRSFTHSHSLGVSPQSSLLHEETSTSRQSTLRSLMPGWTAARRKSSQEIAKAKSLAYVAAMCSFVRRSGSSAGSSSRRSEEKFIAKQQWSLNEF